MSVASTETYSPYPPSEVESPAPMSSPLATRTTITRTSTPRGTQSKSETAKEDGDVKLKNFFQSLLVNKGK